MDFRLVVFKVGFNHAVPANSTDWDFGFLEKYDEDKERMIVLDLNDFKSVHETNIPKIKIVESPDTTRPGFYLYHTGFERFILNSARFISLESALNIVNTSLMFSDWEFDSNLYALIGSQFFSQYKFFKETVMPTLRETKQIY